MRPRKRTNERDRDRERESGRERNCEGKRDRDRERGEEREADRQTKKTDKQRTVKLNIQYINLRLGDLMMSTQSASCARNLDHLHRLIL